MFQIPVSLTPHPCHGGLWPVTVNKKMNPLSSKLLFSGIFSYINKNESRIQCFSMNRELVDSAWMATIHRLSHLPSPQIQMFESDYPDPHLRISLWPWESHFTPALLAHLWDGTIVETPCRFLRCVKPVNILELLKTVTGHLLGLTHLL